MTSPNTDITIPANMPELRNPWLVAAWPGMGGVAAIAGGHLVQTVGAKPAGTLPEREFFSIEHVDVRNGIARTGALPRCMFFAWHNPDGERDLLVFLGEAQPPTGGFALCHRIMDAAIAHGVERVVTFAAMGTALHPSSEPRVFGATTAPDLLESMEEAGIERLREGQVSGLNGALLAAASDRGVPAVCLLGEMPFFASGVPNPKASIAVLESFERLSGIPVETDALQTHAKAIEPQMLQLLEQLREQAAAGGNDPVKGLLGGEDEGEAEETDDRPATDTGGADAAAHREKPLDLAARQRIEELFQQARADRGKAVHLKEELDRLGAFGEYEDRFLDLFRKGE